MTVLLAAILLGLLPENPVFVQLTQQGVCVGPEAYVKLASPTMADGLDATAQQQAIEGVAGPNRRVSNLTRKSVVAPFVMKIGQTEVGPGQSPLRRVDVWFVAYGRLEQFTEEESLEKLADVADSGKPGRLPKKSEALTEEALRQRGLSTEDTQDRVERYVFSTFPLFDRVQLSTTQRIVVTRRPQSILVAGTIAPTFQDDPTYPNQWQSLKRNERGLFDFGEPRPYQAAGFYAKVTQLAEPAGALFIEYHQVFDEPREWFGGANLLRSKLPLMVQDSVRKLRRRLIKGP